MPGNNHRVYWRVLGRGSDMRLIFALFLIPAVLVALPTRAEPVKFAKVRRAAKAWMREHPAK